MTDIDEWKKRYTRIRTRKNPVEQRKVNKDDFSVNVHPEVFSGNKWMTDIDEWKKRYTRIRTRKNPIEQRKVNKEDFSGNVLSHSYYLGVTSFSLCCD